MIRAFGPPRPATPRCYYYPEKDCAWGCSTRCDAGWDFVAGGTPCIRPFVWLFPSYWLQRWRAR